RMLSTWLSPDDPGRLLEAWLTAERPGFRVIFGVSANTRGAGCRWPRPAPWATARGTAQRRTPPRSSRRTASPIRTTRRCGSLAARSPCRMPRSRRPGRPVLVPALEDLGDLPGDELEEGGVLGEPRAGRRARAEQFDPLSDQRRPALHDLVAQAEQVA